MDFSFKMNSSTGETRSPILTEQNTDEFGLWDHVTDIGRGVGRGIQQAGVELYSTVDWLSGDDWLPDVPDDFGIAKSKTVAGSLVEGIVQFAAGFVPFVGVAGKIGKAAHLTSKVGKLAAAKKAAGAVKTAKTIEYGAGFGKSMLAGAATDFAVYDAHEDRLSNMLTQFPVLRTPITEYLEAEEDDTILEGKLKNSLEGLLLGGLSETLIVGVKALKNMRKVRKIKQAQESTQPVDDIYKSKEQIDEGARAEETQIDLENEIQSKLENRSESPLEEKISATEEPPRTIQDADAEEMMRPVDVENIEGKRLETEKRALEGVEKEYKERVRKDYGDRVADGPDWKDKLSKRDLKKYEEAKEVARKAATAINMERTPKEGSPINLDRFSATKGNDENLWALMNGDVSNQFEIDLRATDKWDHETVIREADNANSFVQEATGEGFSRKQLHQYQDEMLKEGSKIAGQMKEIIVKQNILRRYAQQYTKLMDDLAEKALQTGSKADEYAWLMAEKKSEEVVLIIKRNQEKLSQALGAQRIVATDIGSPKQLSAFLHAADDEEMINAGLAKMVGGDASDQSAINAGQNLIKKKILRYQEAKSIAGEGAGLRTMAKNASKSQMITEYWMNSILSGPITHGVNAISNGLNTILLPLEKSVGGLLTLNTREMKSGMAMFYYLSEQNISAWKLAATAFKSETDILDPMTRSGWMDSGNIDRALSSKNPVLDFVGQALNLPSRMLLTADTLFKQLNYRALVKAELVEKSFDQVDSLGRKLTEIGGDAQATWIAKEFDKVVQKGEFYSYQSLRDQAEKSVRASNEYKNLKKSDPDNKAAHGQHLRRGIDKFMKQNWNEDHGVMAEKALNYARTATWTNALTSPDRHTISQMAGGFQRLVNDYPLMRLVFPFIRTPTNVIAFFLERSVGVWGKLAKRGYKNSLRVMKRQADDIQKIHDEGGESLQELLGKAATGASFMALSTAAYGNGWITGGGPQDIETRRMWESTGWQPYSIQLGGRYYSYRRFDPFASFLAIVADVGEALKEADAEDQEFFEAIAGSLTFAVAQNVTNKSFLTGMARVANVLSNPGRFSDSYLRQTAASFLPYSSFFGQTLAPEYQTEVRNLVDSLRAKYGLVGNSPMFGREVPSRYNVLGEQLERQKPWPYMPVVYYSDIKDDLILNELKDLRHGWSPPSHTLAGLNLDTFINQDGKSAWTTWTENHGKMKWNGRTLRQTLRDTIKSSGYKRTPRDSITGEKSPRVEILRRVVRKFRALALQKTLTQFPDLQRQYKTLKSVRAMERAGAEVPESLTNIINF